jgi:hypothetical protein
MVPAPQSAQALDPSHVVVHRVLVASLIGRGLGTRLTAAEAVARTLA